jgi:hypothetical protein
MPVCKNNIHKKYTGMEPSPKGFGFCASVEKEGTKMKGKDGNIWIKKNGRWFIYKKKTSKKLSKKISKKLSKKLSKKISKKLSKKLSKKISLEKLKEINKKYNITSSGTKEELVLRLWNIRNVAISNEDLMLIIDFLKKKEQDKVRKLIEKRNNNHITNYKGMWEKNEKPLTKMNSSELIKKLQKFRDVWEKITKINQDLSDDRIYNETVKSLRSLLKFYYSNEAKLIAHEWLNKKN